MSEEIAKAAKQFSRTTFSLLPARVANQMDAQDSDRFTTALYDITRVLLEQARALPVWLLIRHTTVDGVSMTWTTAVYSTKEKAQAALVAMGEPSREINYSIEEQKVDEL